MVGAQGIPAPEDRLAHFSLHFVGLLPWVSAFHSEHLGGETNRPKVSLLPAPVLREAMKTITNSITSTTGLPSPHRPIQDHARTYQTAPRGMPSTRTTGASREDQVE